MKLDLYECYGKHTEYFQGGAVRLTFHQEQNCNFQPLNHGKIRVL